MPEEYVEGTLVKCKAEFTAVDTGAYVDPATVTARITNPSGTTTVYVYGVDAALVKDATGRYRVNVNANQNGTWTWRFESTGTYQGAGDSSFFIYGGP